MMIAYRKRRHAPLSKHLIGPLAGRWLRAPFGVWLARASGDLPIAKAVGAFLLETLNPLAGGDVIQPHAQPGGMRAHALGDAGEREQSLADARIEFVGGQGA